MGVLCMDNHPWCYFQSSVIAHLQTKHRSFTGDPSSARAQELQEKERGLDEQENNESFSSPILLFRSSFDH